MATAGGGAADSVCGAHRGIVAERTCQKPDGPNLEKRLVPFSFDRMI